MKYIVSLSIFLFISVVAFSQKERKFIREGNDQYESEKFEDSEVEYRKALEKEADSFEAAFNLGDALYKQEKFEDAAKQFEALAQKDLDKEKLAKVYHNLGNSFMQSQKLEESIDAYKKALRNNPKDMDTKYNLAYAMRMVQKQQQQQQSQDQDKDQQKQDQQKDQEEERKDEQQQQQDQQKQDQKDKEQQQISKEDAERMLEALENDEKELQEKLQRIKAKSQKVYIEKDW